MATFSCCLLLSLFILLTNGQSPGVLSTAQKQYILDMHNDVRNTVAMGSWPGNNGVNLPAATNMNELLWDDGLAALATDYSQLCIYGHSYWDTDDLIQYESITSFELPAITAQPWFKYLGENLAFSSLTPVEFLGQYGIEGGVQGWIDEGSNYTYGTIPEPTPSPTDEVCTVTTCQHFSQVIWAETRYIGCGWSDCDGVVGFPWAMNLVCQYYTAGNFQTQYPYESGTECSNCDGDRTSNCDPIYADGLCGGGVDSSFNIDGTTDVDTCDNGLGLTLPNTEGDCTSAPTTPAPVTPSPTTPSPTTPSPTTPSPTTPSPTTPSPTTPRPTTPAPITPAPVTPAPTTPTPTTPAPVTPAPTTPRPTTPAPVTPSPVTPAPVTPTPTTPRPTTPAPTTPSPTTPAPVTPAPVTPAPVTPAPVTPAPTTADIDDIQVLMSGEMGITQNIAIIDIPNSNSDLGRLDLRRRDFRIDGSAANQWCKDRFGQQSFPMYPMDINMYNAMVYLCENKNDENGECYFGLVRGIDDIRDHQMNVNNQPSCYQFRTNDPVITMNLDPNDSNCDPMADYLESNDEWGPHQPRCFGEKRYKPLNQCLLYDPKDGKLRLGRCNAKKHIICSYTEGEYYSPSNGKGLRQRSRNP